MIWSAIRLIPPDGVSRRKGKWTGEYIVTKRRDTKNSVRLSPIRAKNKNLLYKPVTPPANIRN